MGRTNGHMQGALPKNTSEQLPESLTQAVMRGLRNATGDEIGCGCQQCQLIAISVTAEVTQFLANRYGYGARE